VVQFISTCRSGLKGESDFRYCLRRRLEMRHTLLQNGPDSSAYQIMLAPIRYLTVYYAAIGLNLGQIMG